MGIKVEYNPDLALRPHSFHESGERKEEECVPEKLIVGQEYGFLKRGQRLYWFDGEIPLLTTTGSENLSAPIASIVMIEAIHRLIDGEVWTQGKYKVTEVFTDSQPRFNGFAKI